MPRTFLILAPEMPDRAALQAAIQSLKFKLTLDDGYAPFETAGYLPCTVEGEDAGVDMRFEAAAAEAQGRACMRLKWSGDPREALSACIIAAAMVSGFGAEVQDPDKGEVVPAEALLKKAKTLLADSF
jgi:hypothetical protein